MHGEAARLRDAERASGKVAVPAPPTSPLAAEVKPPQAHLDEVDIDPGPTPLPESAPATRPAEVVAALEEAEPPIAVAALSPEPAAAQLESAAPAVDLGTLLESDVEAELEPEPLTAVPEEVTQDRGAIPSQPMQEIDSGRNLSPLAQTLAHIAEEAQRRSDGAGGFAEELNAEDDLELVDAPLDTGPAAPAIRSVAPPLPILPVIALSATPPPIPAILAKGSSQSPLAELSLPEVRPPFPPHPEALAERPRRPKRSKPWFEEIFDEDYLRTLPFMTAQQTMKEVTFIEGALEAPSGAEILDVGCGYGRHAIELVQRGLNVTGLDLSLPLLIRAADEAQRRALSVNFVHADMREMPFDRKFDGAYSMLTSFGYFDEEANLKVAEGVARALKPGGRFLLDVVNRDYVVADLPSRIWWEGTGCVVLEEVDFNFHTSRVVTRRSVVFEDGRQLEQEISVRAYSLHELGRLLRHAGFRVLDISGSLSTRGRFLGVNSRNLLVLSEKRSD
ncbi:MAG TPA: methyltransferase domain-containing protein [Polyangia bacterium]|nr:methyltransferase domain-containing protein [Polyangia bacterium]